MDDLRVFLKRAERLLAFTGAGISTNSGIPDFRGPQGVWKTRQPVYFSQFLISEEARIEYWDYKLEPQPLFDAFAATVRPPRCPHCEGWLKSATISFGQDLDPRTLEAAEHAAMQCDAVVALGSTLSVYPAASFPLMAARRGVPYAIVNRGPTEHDSFPEVTIRHDGDVGVIFPRAVSLSLSGGFR